MKTLLSRYSVLLFTICIPLGLNAQQLGYEAGLSDLSVALQSGFFGGSGNLVGDVPDTTSSWTHLINARHSNANNNHQMQIASTYSMNDRFFFRKIANGASGPLNPPWHEMATRGENTFVGTQTINGAVRATELHADAGGFGPNGSFGVHNAFWTGKGMIVIQPQDSGSEGGEIHFASASPSWTGWGIDHYGGQLRFYNGTAYNVFHANGSVGIGTGTPTGAYKLMVNGSIRAKELVVETNWSDFVFEPGYKLPTLDEVETHIAEHGHLPGVPSAVSIQENGLPVAATQALLMQKVEELTLYMLEMKRENETLRGELDSLRNSLKARE